MTDITQLIGKKKIIVKRSKNRANDQALIITMIAAGYTCSPSSLTLRFDRIDQKPPRIKDGKSTKNRK